MHPFKDKEAREWNLDINVDAIRRVKASLDINLLDVVEGKLIERLASDEILLVDIIYVICQPHAAERSITDEQFGRAMGGDAIDRARDAFFADLIDFFPNGKRQILKMVLQKIDGLQKMTLARVTTEIQSDRLEHLLQKMLSESFGNSPATSA